MIRISTKPSLYRDFALLSVMILFILFLVSIWVSYETYQEYSNDAIKQLENEAVRIDRTLIVEIERASYLLESIARQINNYDTTELHRIELLLKSFDKADYQKKSEFFWLDAHQNIAVSSKDGILKKPVSVSDRDYMKKAITSPWNIHIGQPIQGRVSNRWVMPLAIGVSGANDAFLGAVMVGLDIQSFSKQISTVIKEEGVSFAITNTAFTLLTEISDKKDFFSRSFNLGKLAKINFDTTPSGVYSYTSLFAPKTIYSYYEKSSEYPYIIFVGHDAHISHKAIRSILLPRLMQIFVITIFLVSILWTVRKRIIQPVIELTASTARIIRGEPFQMRSHNVPVEIEQLGAELTRINDYIAERKRIENELSAKNHDLLKIRESAEMTNEMKAQFFEQVGNALMLPAKTISEYADSMKNELFGALGNSKYNDIAEKMYWQSGVIIDLLNEILSISKAESGLLALNDTEIELPLMIKKCIRILQDRMRMRSIDILQDFDDDLPNMLADELRIKQLLLNLLNSAAGKLNPGDVIRLRVQYQREGLVLKLEYVQPELHDQETDAPTQQPLNYRQLQLEGIETPLELGFALNQLIVSMHGGSISSKISSDRRVTVTIIFPDERVVRGISS